MNLYIKLKITENYEQKPFKKREKYSFLNKRNIFGALIVTSLASLLIFTVTVFASPSLFETTDNFVLLAENKVNLERDVQISSGDIGSNNKLDIDKDNIVNGNLFADEIKIEKGSIINGSATFNKLKLKKDAQVLGTQTDNIKLPVAELPTINDFEIGQQDIVFEGENNTLEPGSYKDIKLKQNSTLILNGGTYNLRSLRLEKYSILIFNQPTTLNIQHKLTGNSNIAILSGQNLNQNDLQINFMRKGSKDDDKKDGDDNDDKGNKKDKDKQHGAGFIHFGKNSFLNFKLLAPDAMVRLGKQTTFRGQILADEVHIGKGAILARDIATSLQPKSADIVTTEEGVSFVINQIIVQLVPGTILFDALTIADSVNGSIVGIVPSVDLYQVLISSETSEELESVIGNMNNNPLVKVATKNTIINLIAEEDE